MREPRITNNPENHPYVCSRCGGHYEKREWFLDTGHDTDFDGTIYFCNFCCADFTKIGNKLFTKDDITQYVDTMAAQLVEIKELKEKIISTDMWLRSIGLERIEDGPVIPANDSEPDGPEPDAVSPEPRIDLENLRNEPVNPLVAGFAGINFSR